jgi:hydroxymethylpyrimidine pyrophosphatase-like HAD family hydrolase
MRKIGLRNVKTAVAVFFCLLVNFILIAIDRDFASTWYSPFFSGIAAAYSIQSERRASFRQARIRSVGSVIGGLFGVVIVMVYEEFLQEPITNALGGTFSLALFYLLVTIAVVPLIHGTVLMKQTSATFVVVLTYLSVTVSTRNNYLPVFPFAINRIESTIVGTMLALAVDSFAIPFFRNHDILFVTGLDGALLGRDGSLSGYSRYQLERLLHHGAAVTIATTRTPASLHGLFHGIDFHLPLIIMNGSVLYDAKRCAYSEIRSIGTAARIGIEHEISTSGRNYFTYAIVDDVLAVYHGSFSNPAERRFYDDRKNDFFKNNVRGVPGPDEQVVFYVFLDTPERIEALRASFESAAFAADIAMNVYPFDDVPGYHFLKINGVEASKEHSIRSLVAAYGMKKVIAVGGKAFDVPMMRAADFAIALESATPEVKAAADLVLPGGDPDQIMRTIARLFRTPGAGRLRCDQKSPQGEDV